MRVIAIDTETTGGSVGQGDRCVDIGLTEMVNGRRTGNTWQTYLNPERAVHFGAYRVHGLSDVFLRDKPKFKDVAQSLLDFIDGAPCLAHNARFDRDMILFDFHHSGLEPPRLEWHDTITIAKKEVSIDKYNMDTLSRFLGVSVADRGKHGALEDTDILARILEVLDEKKPGLFARHLKSERCLDAFPRTLLDIRPGLNRVRPASMRPEPADIDGLPLFSGEVPSGTGPLKEKDPLVFAQGLNAGVSDLIAKANLEEGPMGEDQFQTLKCGRDVWSAAAEADICKVAVAAYGAEGVFDAIESCSASEKLAGLRWMCRGLSPDRTSAMLDIKAKLWPDKYPDRRQAQSADQRSFSL